MLSAGAAVTLTVGARNLDPEGAAPSCGFGRHSGGGHKNNVEVVVPAYVVSSSSATCALAYLGSCHVRQLAPVTTGPSSFGRCVPPTDALATWQVYLSADGEFFGPSSAEITVHDRRQQHLTKTTRTVNIVDKLLRIIL